MADRTQNDMWQDKADEEICEVLRRASASKAKMEFSIASGSISDMVAKTQAGIELTRTLDKFWRDSGFSYSLAATSAIATARDAFGAKVSFFDAEGSEIPPSMRERVLNKNRHQRVPINATSILIEF